MYIFVYVPAAGRIASATARNRAGPFPMQAPSEGGRARACGGRLQRRGTSLLCDTSAIEADRSSHRLSVPLSVPPPLIITCLPAATSTASKPN